MSSSRLGLPLRARQILLGNNSSRPKSNFVIYIDIPTSKEDHCSPASSITMKDLDSFTEGTGQGSFDFLPRLITAAEEGLPLIYHPPDNIDHHPASDLLPSFSNYNAVLAWRENVVNDSPKFALKKRRRSLTLDGKMDIGMFFLFVTFSVLMTTYSSRKRSPES